jgi:RHS repeat-associated protein
VTDAYAYDPYGKLFTHQGKNAQPFTFVGRWGVRQEGGSGALYQMRARYYDAAMARFLSREPLWPQISDPRQINPHSYANANPLKYVDVDGTGLLDVAKAAVKLAKDPTIENAMGLAVESKKYSWVSLGAHLAADAYWHVVLPAVLEEQGRGIREELQKRDAERKAAAKAEFEALMRDLDRKIEFRRWQEEKAQEERALRRGVFAIRAAEPNATATIADQPEWQDLLLQAGRDNRFLGQREMVRKMSKDEWQAFMAGIERRVFQNFAGMILVGIIPLPDLYGFHMLPQPRYLTDE